MTEIETTISTVIIPLLGIAVMAAIYFITRNKQTEDTTLLNNADIRNIITETKDREKRQEKQQEERDRQLEEWNKNHREDMKQIFKELQQLNNLVNVHEFKITYMERNRDKDNRGRGGGGDNNKSAV